MVEYTKTDIIAIAKWQKNLLWLIVISLLLGFIMGFMMALNKFTVLETPIGILFCILGVFQFVVIYQLCTALKSNAIVWMLLYLLLCWIPILGLIILFLLIRRASNAMKTKGIRIGIMGVNQGDLDKYIADTNMTG